MPSTTVSMPTNAQSPASIVLKPEGNAKSAFDLVAPTANNPLATFRVQRAQQKDLADINEFLLGDFLHNEPLNNALELSKEESKQFFAGLIESTLPDGVSYVIRDPSAGNRVVAVRLASIIHNRSSGSNGKCQGKEGGEEKGTPTTATATTAAEGSFAEWQSKENNKVSQICGILHELESKIWHLVPEGCNCLASWLVLSVDSNYKRRGIAAALLQYKLDEFLERGCQGIVTEASALNSQKLFQKLGYRRLFELRHSEWRDGNTGEQVFHCADGTDRVTLEFMPLANCAAVMKQMMMTMAMGQATAAKKLDK